MQTGRLCTNQAFSRAALKVPRKWTLKRQALAASSQLQGIKQPYQHHCDNQAWCCRRLGFYSAPFSLRPLVDGKKRCICPLHSCDPCWFPKFAVLAAIGLPELILSIIYSNHGQFCPHQTCVFPIFHRQWKMSNDGAKKSDLDLGTPPWALGTFAVSIHVPLSQPKMHLEQMQSQAAHATRKEFAVNSMPNF